MEMLCSQCILIGGNDVLLCFVDGETPMIEGGIEEPRHKLKNLLESYFSR